MWSGFAGFANRLQALGQRLPIQPEIAAVGDRAEPLRDTGPGSVDVGGEDAWHLAVAVAGVQHTLDRGEVRGCENWPGIPSETERSKCPIQSTSIPATAAISSTADTPAAVSIWAMVSTSSLAWRIVATRSPAT